MHCYDKCVMVNMIQNGKKNIELCFELPGKKRLRNATTDYRPNVAKHIMDCLTDKECIIINKLVKVFAKCVP